MGASTQTRIFDNYTPLNSIYSNCPHFSYVTRTSTPSTFSLFDENPHHPISSSSWHIQLYHRELPSLASFTVSLPPQKQTSFFFPLRHHREPPPLSLIYSAPPSTHCHTLSHPLISIIITTSSPPFPSNIDLRWMLMKGSWRQGWWWWWVRWCVVWWRCVGGKKKMVMVRISRRREDRGGGTLRNFREKYERRCMLIKLVEGSPL